MAGRHILRMIDERFKISEADGAVCELEHLLTAKLKNDNLDEYITDWEALLSGIKINVQPDDSLKRSLVLGDFENRFL